MDPVQLRDYNLDILSFFPPPTTRVIARKHRFHRPTNATTDIIAFIDISYPCRILSYHGLFPWFFLYGIPDRSASGNSFVSRVHFAAAAATCSRVCIVPHIIMTDTWAWPERVFQITRVLLWTTLIQQQRLNCSRFFTPSYSAPESYRARARIFTPIRFVRINRGIYLGAALEGHLFRYFHSTIISPEAKILRIQRFWHLRYLEFFSKLFRESLSRGIFLNAFWIFYILIHHIRLYSICWL